MSAANPIETRDSTPLGTQQWLPFTPNREFLADPKLFASASRQHYYDASGRAILDGSSGLFTTPAGHGRQEIAQAVYDQLLKMDFCAGFTRAHAGSFALAERLAGLLPEPLNHVFFASSGSDAVDTAMKISIAYHRARREPSRTMFVSRERAYHGSNLSGTALSGMVNNRRAFGNPVSGVVHMRHTWLPEQRMQPGQPTVGAELADDLLRLIQLHGAENIAACVVEPVAGSTGTLVPPVGYLDRLRELCTTHGILLVFDEVICGFGRTGESFAAQSFGVTPDIITMAKAITNGAIPMSAVAVSDEIYRTVIDSAVDDGIEFFHGYTWSGHPVACAAALATQDIYANERLFERGRALSPYFLNQLHTLADLPAVFDIRGYGMIAGIEIHPDGKPGQRGHRLQKHLFEQGLHLKATGDTAILAPPLIFEREDVDRMIGLLRDALAALD
ncbi:aminotransferase class III-fold pyridoxal phosphate-dependent enzyme [Acidihalobacter prosperus]|uniref:Aspartate aminotransferase family protein n=1 Tax=Acidihalobacter prosperus TaxID=160660 RepID=A0A1A6C3J2_9GAMM|nr:aminotransferase class III-fold pyridoxal phosphate-dependent enzyme [Acidihalobacter prosperus]OBS09131.1 aspartate aminotransferase family protein [Acidihalobacter prosperus]